METSEGVTEEEVFRPHKDRSNKDERRKRNRRRSRFSMMTADVLTICKQQKRSPLIANTKSGNLKQSPLVLLKKNEAGAYKRDDVSTQERLNCLIIL